MQNVVAKASPDKAVAAASAPAVAPPATDFELSRILEAGDSDLPEALNFDLQMPDMSKVTTNSYLSLLSRALCISAHTSESPIRIRAPCTSSTGGDACH